MFKISTKSRIDILTYGLPFDKLFITSNQEMKLLYKLLFLLFISIGTNAQPYLDLGNVVYHASPGGDPKIFTHFRAQANLPLVMKDSSIFVINPNWEERWIKINEQSEQVHLRGFITWLTYSKPISRNWSAMMAFIPRWNGEPSVQFSNGFQAGGAILMTNRVSPAFTYKFGLYYNREFWGNFFIPLIGVDWIINKKQRLFGILPGYLTYENRISSRISWGGNFRTFTNSYRLSEKQISNAIYNFMRIDDNQLGAYADAYLTKNLVITGEAGYSLFRKVREGYGKTSKEEYLVLSNNSAPYFKLTLQYRIRLDK